MGISLRRHLVNLRRITSKNYSSNHPDGFKLSPIVKGEEPDIDLFIKDVLKLPEKTTVFHCATNKLIPPIEIIGGRETRLVGDTCRMFYKIKQEGKVADYYFWDGIVPEGLFELGSSMGSFSSSFDSIIEDMEGLYFQRASHDIGLATGKTSYKVVLTEKTKKAPQKW